MIFLQFSVWSSTTDVNTDWKQGKGKSLNKLKTKQQGRGQRGRWGPWKASSQQQQQQKCTFFLIIAKAFSRLLELLLWSCASWPSLIGRTLELPKAWSLYALVSSSWPLECPWVWTAVIQSTRLETLALASSQLWQAGVWMSSGEAKCVNIQRYSGLPWLTCSCPSHMKVSIQSPISFPVVNLINILKIMHVFPAVWELSEQGIEYTKL